MSLKDKAQGALGGAAAERLGGETAGGQRAATGAAMAGGLTSVVVFRLLRNAGDN